MDKGAALYFYEQCAGTHAGEYANIPNSPIIHSLVQQYSTNFSSNTHAMALGTFKEFLENVLEALPQ